MRTILAVMSIACLSSACTIGMSTREFKLAGSPHGVRTAVSTAGGEFEGELIEVRDASVVILEDGASAGGPGVRAQRLRMTPFSAIRLAKFEQRPALRLRDGKPPSAAMRERLRLVSRFPYGMSPAVERDLLKAYGQDSFAGLER